MDEDLKPLSEEEVAIGELDFALFEKVLNKYFETEVIDHVVRIMVKKRMSFTEIFWEIAEGIRANDKRLAKKGTKNAKSN